MIFKTFQMIIDGLQPKKKHIQTIAKDGLKFFKYFDDCYEIEKEFLDERFLWIYFQYDNAKLYNDYVWDERNEEKKENPRPKTQIELRKQLFLCFDLENNILYLSNMDKRGFVQQYFSDTLQLEILIKNIYTSLEDFQNSIKYIKQLKFIQINNLCNDMDDTIFTKQSTMLGLDAPSKISMQVEYNTPIGRARNMIQNFKKWKDKGQFESIIFVGEDDSGLEQSFDFSSVIKSIKVSPAKNDNGRFNQEETKRFLLNEIRCKNNV